MKKIKTKIKQEVETGRLLFAQSCTFLYSVAQLNQIPNSNLPEIAFAGRSNVGKSSLINSLTNQNKLAFTSSTPGRTQQINFFSLAERIMLVDLPGYGYAKAPKKLVAGWTELIELYLRGRAELRRCLLLIDARHGLKKNDILAMSLLDEVAQPYQIILTKCDKVKLVFLEMVISDIKKIFPLHTAVHPDIIVSSSTTGTGIGKIRAAIASLALPRT